MHKAPAEAASCGGQPEATVGSSGTEYGHNPCVYFLVISLPFFVSYRPPSPPNLSLAPASRPADVVVCQIEAPERVVAAQQLREVRRAVVPEAAVRQVQHQQALVASKV